jgi:curved DNA-binding protein
MAAPRDFYEVLGVARDATAAQIQRAYRKLAREFHPDMNKSPEAEDRFKEVAEAYEVLSDAEQRRRYDAFGSDFRRVPDGVDPAAWSSSRAGSSGAGRRRTRTATGANVTGDADFSSIFEDLFGGRFGSVAGADQEAEIVLSVDEAFRGTKRRFEVGSAGRSIEVNVPAGVRAGQRIRLAGQGGEGFGDGRRGDLYLRVRIAPDPRYRLDGRNLHVDLPLAPWEAALGVTLAVATPGGDEKVEVPPGTSSGQQVRVVGKGLPSRAGKAGDLVAEVRIVVPRRLTKEERRLFEELGRTSHFDARKAAR